MTSALTSTAAGDRHDAVAAAMSASSPTMPAPSSALQHRLNALSSQQFDDAQPHFGAHLFTPFPHANNNG
jgi:hypothetical protein